MCTEHGIIQLEINQSQVFTAKCNELQVVVKVRGLVNYPVRSCGQRIPVNFKNSNGTVGRKRFVAKS